MGDVARRGAHLAAERSPSIARADGARRSVAVPNGEGVASGSATSKSINHRYLPCLVSRLGCSQCIHFLLLRALFSPEFQHNICKLAA